MTTYGTDRVESSQAESGRKKDTHSFNTQAETFPIMLIKGTPSKENETSKRTRTGIEAQCLYVSVHIRERD